MGIWSKVKNVATNVVKDVEKPVVTETTNIIDKVQKGDTAGAIAETINDASSLKPTNVAIDIAQDVVKEISNADNNKK
jgi:hypothetical protein